MAASSKIRYVCVLLSATIFIISSESVSKKHKLFWHKQKKWKSLYTSHIEKATTCIMGNKKKGKYIDVD